MVAPLACDSREGVRTLAGVCALERWRDLTDLIHMPARKCGLMLLLGGRGGGDQHASAWLAYPPHLGLKKNLHAKGLLNLGMMPCQSERTK